MHNSGNSPSDAAPAQKGERMFAFLFFLLIVLVLVLEKAVCMPQLELAEEQFAPNAIRSLGQLNMSSVEHEAEHEHEDD